MRLCKDFSLHKQEDMLAENEGIMKSVQAEDDYTAVETCSWLM
jgi:hypothetical protein